MIEWLRQLGQASRNLGRIARQNPVWAVQSLIFAPFRFSRHLFGVLVLTIIVAVILILGSDGLVWYFGLYRYPMLHGVISALVLLAILLVPLRALFQPLILHYEARAPATRTARPASPPMPRRAT